MGVEELKRIYDSKYKDILRESMDGVFFHEMNVKVVRADHVDLMESGKSRFIVNKLRQRN